MAIERKVIEWTPGRWWVVRHDPRPGRGYFPLYEAKSKADAEAWLAANPAEPPAAGLELWTPDEVAECLDGISDPTYAELWNALGGMAETKPLGGDGSNGTVEWPEPTERKHSVVAIWSQLTERARSEINAAWAAKEGA